MSEAKKREQIIAKSVDFISKNIGLMSNNLPNEFLEKWIDDEPVMQVSKGGCIQYTIFMYAWTKYHHSLNQKEFNATEKMIQDAYFAWQTKLSLTMLQQQGMLQLKPFKVFDFGDLDEMKIDFEP